MMKRIFLLLMIAVSAFSLASCGLKRNLEMPGSTKHSYKPHDDTDYDALDKQDQENAAPDASQQPAAPPPAPTPATR